MNDRLDKRLESAQKERDANLQQNAPKAKAKEVESKKVEVAKTATKKPIVKKNDKKKAKEMGGMSM